MRHCQRTILLVLTLSAILLAGCTFIDIQNLSDANVRVLVHTPDSGSGYTRLIESGEVASVFSGHGGRYSITTLPNEEYRQLVLDVRDQIGTRLFEERATLSGADVAQLVQRMQDLTDALENLGNEAGSCTGNVPDFETAVVTVFWDESVSKWALNCG